MSDQLHFDAPQPGPRESHDARARPQAPPPDAAPDAAQGGRDVHLIDYVKVLYKRRLTAITAFVLVAGSVTIYTFTATPVFEARMDAEPGEVGFDPVRLSRIDTHFRRYVDDGRLAGWTIAVARHGRVVHLAHHGLADIQAGRPVADDTLWRIYSMTKPITSVAAMMLLEQGALELTDPVSRYIPAFADLRVYTAARRPTPAPCRPPSRCGCGTCSPTPRVSPTASTTRTPSTRCTGRKGFEFSAPQGMDLAAACDAWARIPLAAPAGRGVELLGRHRRARPGGRGRVRPVASTSSSPTGSSGRSA